MSLSNLRSYTLVASIAALAGVGFACRSATDAADTQGAIATDRPVYRIITGDVVHVRLVNRGPAPIYTEFPSFNVSLQKQRGLTWDDLGAFWYGILAVVPHLAVLAAGDTLQSIPVSTVNSHLRGPGRFRFVYTVYSDSTLHRLLPLEARISNVFDIVY
jgi:hypothetical protein